MTAYEMRISDWSSDVCSSDLVLRLTSLSIRNVVLIGALDLEFGAGLGVLTGETGQASPFFSTPLGLPLGRGPTAAWCGKVRNEQDGRASWRGRVCTYV